MAKRDILQDALAAPPKEGLESHRRAIEELRRKNYSWREIAEFLTERGVATDHTKVFRFMSKKNPGGTMNMTIPTATEYKNALEAIKMSDKQRKMLQAHYHAHNRTITAKKLAQAAGEAEFQTANLMYGRLGYLLGEKLNFPFTDLDAERKFYSSSIGMEVKSEYKTSGEFELIMHHELAKALEQLQ